MGVFYDRSTNPTSIPSFWSTRFGLEQKQDVEIEQTLEGANVFTAYMTIDGERVTEPYISVAGPATLECKNDQTDEVVWTQSFTIQSVDGLAD